MINEFLPYELALRLKALGFDESTFGGWCHPFDNRKPYLQLNQECEYDIVAPTFSQAINFLYICSNKQIDIELKASDTYEERLRKIDQGCEDLRNLQNSKSN